MGGTENYAEPNETISELLRVFWKTDNFRTVGMGLNKIDYPTMQGCYEDYECSIPYSDYIELFPVLDDGYVRAVNKKQSKGAK